MMINWFGFASMTETIAAEIYWLVLAVINTDKPVAQLLAQSQRRLS